MSTTSLDQFIPTVLLQGEVDFEDCCCSLSGQGTGVSIRLKNDAGVCNDVLRYFSTESDCPRLFANGIFPCRCVGDSADLFADEGLHTCIWEGRTITLHVACENTVVGTAGGAQKLYNVLLKILPIPEEEFDRNDKKGELVKRDREVLNRLLVHCARANPMNLKLVDRLNVYTCVASGMWISTSRIHKRSPDNLYLPKSSKEDLLEAIEKFRLSREEYESFGIPYKMNILLYGPPGTGKTTLAHVIASKFNMDIALLELGSFKGDLDFNQTMTDVPLNTLLLVEDIDAMFDNRNNTETNRNVTFSKFINVLDGVSHVDGQITILTTNNKKILDRALVRAGRMDLCIPMGHMGKEQFEQIVDRFKILFPEVELNSNILWQVLAKRKIVTSVLQKWLWKHRHNRMVMKQIDELVQFIDESTSDEQHHYMYV